MSDGVFWAIEWEVRANRQDFVANPGSDQWIQPERAIQLAALWVCGRNAAQMTLGSEVRWEWAPLKEMNPFSDEPPTEMDRPQLDYTPPWRMDAAAKTRGAAKPAPPDYPPGMCAPWRIDAAKKISDVANSASPMKASRAAKRVHKVDQEAQQMKRRCFDRMIRESAVTKQLFMALVSRPTLMTSDGIMALMEEMRDVKASEEYQELMRMAAKKADDEEKLKCKLDELGVPHGKENMVIEAWIRMKQEQAPRAYQ